MTIIYQYKVANTSLCGFLKLLTFWRGSVYKLLFKETLIFIGLYTAISLTYRLALDTEQRKTFEDIAKYCNNYTSLIPISFVLGFYVTVVIQRWWQQFINVPWPDRTLFIMTSYLHGVDEPARIIRRTVARYMLFGLIIILRSISVSVMKRFPTMEHIVDAGFVTHEEVITYERVKCEYNKFWVPLVWANHVLTNARRDGRIQSDIGFRLVIEQLADFRDKCSLCFVYDWITIPLVYTQVVTLSVYVFFLACLVGRQFVYSDEGQPDLYVPIFTLLQFFFYMGWLKVAEQLINPFGEDDDDYDMNWLIDRHTSVAWCLVDECYGMHPPLVKDAHFSEIQADIPYTEAARSSKKPYFIGSTSFMEKPSIQDQMFVNPELLEEPGISSRRYRGHGLRERLNTNTSVLGSLWSLFNSRSNLHKSNISGSRETMLSQVTTANGHVGNLTPSAGRKDSGTFVPFESNTSIASLGDQKTHAEHVQLKPIPRFTVEVVPDAQEVDASKQSRNKQRLDKHMAAAAAAATAGPATSTVSRPPQLSAIDEVLTVRSMIELESPGSSSPGPSTPGIGAPGSLFPGPSAQILRGTEPLVNETGERKEETPEWYISSRPASEVVDDMDTQSIEDEDTTIREDVPFTMRRKRNETI